LKFKVRSSEFLRNSFKLYTHHYELLTRVA
jgi:hypothetical protein